MASQCVPEVCHGKLALRPSQHRLVLVRLLIPQSNKDDKKEGEEEEKTKDEAPLTFNFKGQAAASGRVEQFRPDLLKAGLLLQPAKSEQCWLCFEPCPAASVTAAAIAHICDKGPRPEEEKERQKGLACTQRWDWRHITTVLCRKGRSRQQSQQKPQPQQTSPSTQLL